MQNTFHHSQQETEIQQFANKETKKHTLKKKKQPKTTEIVHCYKKKFNWDKRFLLLSLASERTDSSLLPGDK